MCRDFLNAFMYTGLDKIAHTEALVFISSFSTSDAYMLSHYYAYITKFYVIFNKALINASSCQMLIAPS